MNEFLKIFKERGFYQNATDWEGLGKLDKFTAYIGFDCTATSLHVGSLMQIMLLRWLKKTGNTPIVLLGGGTTKVGDPSGKDETRKILTDTDIEENKKGIKRVFERFGLGDAIIVDNDEWLKKLNYIEFLRDVGRHFSVNKMLSFDSVKLRLEREQNLSFLEFNYMILQAYDFAELARKYNCRVQIGGSDQWGNIVNGTELHRKMFYEDNVTIKNIENTAPGDDSLKISAEYNRNQKLFGLTTPLITTSSGAKMGKTAEGAIWLDETRVSPYDYYQFWRNTEDADVIKFLKIFTELPLEQIEGYKKWEGSAQINEAKKILAFEATRLCHGEEEAKKAQDAAITAFEQGGTAGLPEAKIDNKSYKAFELFVAAGLAASNGEARRLIAGGGAKIGDAKVESDSSEIQPIDGMKLSAGKKKHIIIRLS